MEESDTSLDASAASWLTDLGMEDYNLFPQCHLGLSDVDDVEFLASALNPLCSKSYSSETSLERPTKQLKTNTWNSSNITEHFYGFDDTLNQKQNEFVSVSQPQLLENTNFTMQTRKGSSENQNLEIQSPQGQGTKRSTTHAKDHIIAERKRREKLSQSLIALAALIPGLKKMDKASVIGEAIKYTKDLKERLRLLEEESNKRAALMIVDKPQKNSDDDSSSCDESFDATSGSETLPHVGARVSGKEVLLRIHCHKQKGVLVKILDHIQNLHLLLVNSSVLSFGNSIIDITIVAQIGTGYNLTMKDLVRKIRVATLESMS